MSSILSGMYIARQGLYVNQAALNVVSNNVANMNTPGYCKQRVDLETMVLPQSINNSKFSQIGTNAGVQIAQVKRYSNETLGAYLRDQNSIYSKLDTATTVASQIENLFNSLDGSGLVSAFDNFYSAISTLNQDPTNSVTRMNFVEQSKNLALQFNSTANNLIAYREKLVGDGQTKTSLQNSDAADYVNLINEKLKKIANINKEIAAMDGGSSPPNNLLDQRDVALSELSELTNFETTINKNNTVSIYLEGKSILRGSEVTGTFDIQLGDSDNPAHIRILDENGEVKSSFANDMITGGKLGAALEMGGVTSDYNVQGVLDDLNKLAAGFSEIINTIQTQPGAMAMDKNTMTLIEATENIFKDSDGTGVINASNIQINEAVYNDPYLVAAAKVNPATYDPAVNKDEIGNGSNMLDMLNSRNEGSNALDGQTPENYMITLASTVGLKTENMNNQFTTQQAIVESTTNQLNAETGVSLDEELADMIKYQRAYQASARVFNVCNEILEMLTTLGS